MTRQKLASSLVLALAGYMVMAGPAEAADTANSGHSADQAHLAQTTEAKSQEDAAANAQLEIKIKKPLIPVTKDFTLDNGLRVILSEDHSVPVAALAIVYDVGARDEVKGKSGFAHLFEHMMFQGSDNIAKAELFKFIESVG